MVEIDLNALVSANLILCVFLLIYAGTRGNTGSGFLVQLNLSGVIGAINMIIGFFMLFESTGSITTFSAFVIALIGLLAMIHLVTKKTSTNESDTPNTFPFYITLTAFIILLSIYYPIAFGA